MNLATTDWYKLLVEDCKAIVVEAVFVSRWALVEGYHLLGTRIIGDPNYQRNARGNKKVLQSLAQNIGMSDRTLYYAIKFVEKYPKLDVVPEGKNISWTKIVTKYLTDGKEEKEGYNHKCPKCGYKW